LQPDKAVTVSETGRRTSLVVILTNRTEMPSTLGGVNGIVAVLAIGNTSEADDTGAIGYSLV
jgi:hypothetical protein